MGALLPPRGRLLLASWHETKTEKQKVKLV